MVTYLTGSDPSDTESGCLLQLHTPRNHEAHVAVDSGIIGVRSFVLEVAAVDGASYLVTDLERSLEVRANLDNSTSVVTAVNDARKGEEICMLPVGGVLEESVSCQACYSGKKLCVTYLSSVLDLDEDLVGFELRDGDLFDSECVVLRNSLAESGDFGWFVDNSANLGFDPSAHSLRDLKGRHYGRVTNRCGSIMRETGSAYGKGTEI